MKEAAAQQLAAENHTWWYGLLVKAMGWFTTAGGFVGTRKQPTELEKEDGGQVLGRTEQESPENITNTVSQPSASTSAPSLPASAPSLPASAPSLSASTAGLLKNGPSTYVALPGTQGFSLTNLERIQRAEEIIKAGIEKWRLEERGAEYVPQDILTKLHAFAEAVKKQPEDERCDIEMAQVIWRAVARAHYFWDQPALPNVPQELGVIPKSNAMGEALLEDSIAWRASTVCGGSVGKSYPPTTHIDDIEAELTDFLARMYGAGKQTELAYLVFLLWLDEAVYHVLTLDELQEKISLAFDGTDMKPEQFPRFHSKPAMSLDKSSRLENARLVWETSFPQSPPVLKGEMD